MLCYMSYYVWYLLKALFLILLFSCFVLLVSFIWSLCSYSVFLLVVCSLVSYYLLPSYVSWCIITYYLNMSNIISYVLYLIWIQCIHTCIFSFDGKWELSAYFLKKWKKVKNSKCWKNTKNEDLKSEKKWKKWKKVKNLKKWKDLNSEKT